MPIGIFHIKRDTTVGIIASYTTRRNLGGSLCARDCAREAPGHVLQIARAHDVVAVEHGARPVARTTSTAVTLPAG